VKWIAACAVGAVCLGACDDPAQVNTVAVQIVVSNVDTGVVNVGEEPNLRVTVRNVGAVGAAVPT
jgi:hypothetical protein